MKVSLYWRNLGKTDADRRPGRTIALDNGSLLCNECCWKDRECDDRRHFHRESCPYCLGTGINATTRESLAAASVNAAVFDAAGAVLNERELGPASIKREEELEAVR